MKDRLSRARNNPVYGEVPPDGEGEILEPNTLIIEEEILRRGFTTAPNYILDNRSISIAARFTYIILLSFAWQAGSCFPGQNRLARKLGVSRQMVNHYLNELKQKGFIDWQRRGLGKTNVYRILKLPKSEADVKQGLHQDVKPPFHQVVNPALQKEYTEQKDLESSKFRRVEPSEKKEDAAQSGTIAALIESLSKRELHDPTHIHSNASQAMNLWRRSKLPKEEFVSLIHQARKITLAHSGQIRKTAEGYRGTKNRAPYFFSVLQDLMHKTVLTKFRVKMGVKFL